MSEEKWHDLGQGDYKVSFAGECVYIEGSEANLADMEYSVILSPDEALELLKLLEGERSNLERMVLQMKVDGET